MRKAGSGQSIVGTQFVGMYETPDVNVHCNDGLKVMLSNIGNNLGHYFSITLQHPENTIFFFTPRPRFWPDCSSRHWFQQPQRFLSTYLIIDLSHIPVDFVYHSTSTLISYTKLAFKFFRGYNMTRGSKQKHSIKPFVKRCARTFKSRSNTCI